MQFKPDFNRLKKVLLREGEPDIVPLFEYFADPEIIAVVTGKCADAEGITEFYYKLGYDYVYATANFKYEIIKNTANDTAELSRGSREFVDENKGIIENRGDFDRYNWPEIDGAVAYNILQTERLLPEGMKIIIDLAPGGIFECVMWLMGYVPFSYALYEDEQLLWDMFEKITDNMLKVIRYCVETPDMRNIGAIAYGDDMGFKHSTMISPDMLRKFVFPFQKKVASFVHGYGLPLIFHSCGKLDEIMDDLIDYVQIDAKHSFEDIIMPVTEAKKKYGGRVALLGGVDIDFLCRANEEELREYIDKIIRICAPGGGFAIGTGNSVANYVPVKNFLVMLDQCKRNGVYPIKV